MVVHRQILFSLVTAAIAQAMLMRTSAPRVPSLHRIVPRYLKLVTSSKFWPFMLISALMLFVLLVMILLFSVLTLFMPLFCLRVCWWVLTSTHAVVLSMGLLVRSWSSSLLPPIRSMSVDRRLHMILPPVEMEVWWYWNVSCMILSRNRWTRWMGESKHPWRTPTAVFKNCPDWLFKRTTLLQFSYSVWAAWTRPSPILKLLRICHRPTCQTPLNAFLK